MDWVSGGRELSGGCGYEFGASGGEGLKGCLQLIIKRVGGRLERLDLCVIALVCEDYLVSEAGIDSVVDSIRTLFEPMIELSIGIDELLRQRRVWVVGCD